LLAARDPAALTMDDRRLVVRQAVALAMTGDGTQLAELKQRYGTAMASGPLSGAFDLLTTGAGMSASVSNLSQVLQELDTLQSTLARYRAEFSQAPAASTGG
jgi:hypothetical protein